MTSRASRATIAFLAGIALILAGLAAIPLSAGAQPEPTAPGGGLAACSAVEVALDEGYGLTRTALRQVCERR